MEEMTQLTDEQLGKIRENRNKDNTFAYEMGFQGVRLSTGHCHGELTVTEHLMNPIGSVHGGCLFTMADSTAGMAASSYGYKVTTMDADFHYLRAGIGVKKLISEAKVLKRGKRAIVVSVDVMDETERVLCTGTFTFMSLGEPYDAVKDVLKSMKK